MRKIPTRSRRCAQDGALFAATDEYLSVLTEQADVWLRKDYCQKCAEHILPHGHFWKGVIPAQEVDTNPDHSSLLGKFKKLYASEADRSMTYLFALYLERKGILVRLIKGAFEEPYSGEVFQLKPVEVSPHTAQQLSDVLESYAEPSPRIS